MQSGLFVPDVSTSGPASAIESPVAKRARIEVENRINANITAISPNSTIPEIMAQFQTVITALEEDDDIHDFFPSSVDEDASSCTSDSSSGSLNLETDDTGTTATGTTTQSPSIGGNSFGPFLLTQHQIDNWCPGIQLPPDIEFQIAMYSLLCHPRIPRYIYTFAMKLINAYFHSNNEDQQSYLSQFQNHPFPESRQAVENYVQKHFPATKGQTYSIPQETSNEKASSSVETVVFDPVEIIKTSISNPLLWSPEKVPSQT